MKNSRLKSTKKASNLKEGHEKTDKLLLKGKFVSGISLGLLSTDLIK